MSAFCAKHSDKLRNLEVQGAKINRSTDSALISLGGIQAMARHAEDFQIISEVLVYNQYNVIPIRKSIFVDVGMNIGLASVFFANHSWTEKVYAFEPFSGPFGRAQETFDLNSELRSKIVARQAGLADATEKRLVHYSTDGTIAMSINGVGSGPVQQIEILDAAEVFGSICAEAQAKKLGLVVKLDCEGSEFPIMKRLAASSLIPCIDAFMIEWHKGWSPDVSLKDLTAPLTANGYVIFDHTVDADLHAGFFAAANTRPPQL